MSDVYSISWASLETIHSSPYLSIEQQNKVSVLRSRFAYRNIHSNNWSEIYKNLPFYTCFPIISVSSKNKVSDKSFDLCYCGGINSSQKTFPCGINRLCPFCAWTFASSLQNRISFNLSSSYSFLTLAFPKNLNALTSSPTQVKEVYNKLNSIVQSLYKNSLISGALICRELSISSFVESQIYPHIHAILDLSPTRTNSEIFEHLSSYSKSGRKSSSSTFELPHEFESFLKSSPDSPLSFKLSSIPTEDDFFRSIRYLSKPLNLSTPYESEILSNPIPDVNKAMSVLVPRCYHLTTRLQRISGFGTLTTKQRKS